MAQVSKAKVNSFDVDAWRNVLARIYASVSWEDKQTIINSESVISNFVIIPNHVSLLL